MKKTILRLFTKQFSIATKCFGISATVALVISASPVAAQNLNMNNYKVINGANGTADQDYVTLRQVKHASPIFVAAPGASVQDQNLATTSGGGICDGVDDEAQINAALAVGAWTGRDVLLGKGTFVVSTNDMGAKWSGAYAAIRMLSGTRLWGSGSSHTTIKLKAGASGVSLPTYNNNYIIINDDPNNPAAGVTNSDIFIGDLTIDGNSANNGADGADGKVFHGISFQKANNVQCERVVVKNMRGKSGAGKGETFAFDVIDGANATFIECRAERTAGPTATGFSTNRGTFVRYYGCVSENMQYGAGFTSYRGRHVSYSNCIARTNGGMGFNWEFSDDIVYSACHSGGRASLGAASGHPYTPNQSFGNIQNGFCGLGGDPDPDNPPSVHEGYRATLIGCTSNDNWQCGVKLNNTRDVRIIGGSFSNNGQYGISIWQDAVAKTTIVNDAIIKNNPSGNYQRQGYNNVPSHGRLNGAAPAISNSANVLNPFPFDVTIFIIGGSLSQVKLIDRDGGAGPDMGVLRTVVLPAGCSIRLTYTGTPSWQWFGG